MTVSRLHPSQGSRQRLSLLTVLGLIDLAAAGFLTLLLAFLVAPQDLAAILTLWLLAMGAAWVLTRRARHALGLDSYSCSRAVTTPLLAAALAFGLSRLAQLDLFSTSLLVLPVTWGGVMLLARLVLRRQAPGVLIGICGTTGPLPRHRRVVYVPLTNPENVSLHEVDALLFDPVTAPSLGWMDLLLHAQAAGTPIWTTAALNEELQGQVALEYLRTTRLDSASFDDTYALLKRVLDVLAVLLALPLLLPLMLAVALLVAVDAGRPVLFSQWRIGQYGRPFRIAKFRTMKRDSECLGAAFAQAGDLRVTRLGGWLRKFRLDELPQFWNVLRGDMSIIGPRPEQQAFAEQFEREIRLYPVRHWVKPGITGWAQVMHGYAAGTDETLEKLRYDMYYIKHFSFWLDARIVVKTIWTILTGFGAR